MREYHDLVLAREAAQPGEYLLFCVKRPFKAGVCGKGELRELPTWWHVHEHIEEDTE